MNLEDVRFVSKMVEMIRVLLIVIISAVWRKTLGATQRNVHEQTMVLMVTGSCFQLFLRHSATLPLPVFVFCEQGVTVSTLTFF